MTRLYSIFDNVAGEYGLPYPSKNDKTAIRMFRNILHSTQNVDVDDYSLFYVGDFDSDNGTFEVDTHENKQPICSGSDALADFEDVSVEKGDEN